MTTFSTKEKGKGIIGSTRGLKCTTPTSTFGFGKNAFPIRTVHFQLEEKFISNEPFQNKLGESKN